MAAEQTPLVPAGEDAPGAAPPRRGVLLPLALCAALAGTAATVHSSGASAAGPHPHAAEAAAVSSLGASSASSHGSSSSATTSYGSSASSLKLFKRTFASTDAFADAEFARFNLGLGQGGNYTYTSEEHGTTCATRAIVRALGDWEVHYFTSKVTREGSEHVSDWVKLWTTLHGAPGADDFEWDEFAPMLVTLFTTDLSPFVERLRANGVSFLAIADADDDDSGGGAATEATTETAETTAKAATETLISAPSKTTTLYSLYVAAPSSGHLYQLTSDALSNASHAPAFGTAPASMCAASLRLAQPTAYLRDVWDELGGEVCALRSLVGFQHVGFKPHVSRRVSRATLQHVPVGVTHTAPHRRGASP